jgi:hypothetical protein
MTAEGFDSPLDRVMLGGSMAMNKDVAGGLESHALNH